MPTERFPKGNTHSIIMCIRKPKPNGPRKKKFVTSLQICTPLWCQGWHTLAFFGGGVPDLEFQYKLWIEKHMVQGQHAEVATDSDNQHYQHHPARVDGHRIEGIVEARHRYAVWGLSLCRSTLTRRITRTR